MKLSQENVVLIVVALALGAVLWWQLGSANGATIPTPEAPIPDPNAPLAQTPWYFGNQTTPWQTAVPPIFNVLPRMTAGQGAGGAQSYAYNGMGCKSCGVPPGIRN